MNWFNRIYEKDLLRDNPKLRVTDEVKEYLLGAVAGWRDIYAGGGDWRYTRKGGLEDGIRRVGSLGAAKALCSELAALCFSQQTDIGCDNGEVYAFLMKTLEDNAFWSCFPLFLEKMFALGAGVIKVYTQGGEVKLDYISCDGFIPVQYDDKGVYGGVIVSASESDGKRYLLLESQLREGGGYVIENKLYEVGTDGRIKSVPLSDRYTGLKDKTLVMGLKKPLFVYFRPASADNLGALPLGVSVYASAVDILRSLDVVFDSLEREFILGRKRIIVPASAVRGEYDRSGKLVKYFDTSDEVYQALSADDNDELKITDNSVGLRVTEHTGALESLLDMLCMQVGLSQGTLSYHTDSARTATEVISRNSKTFRTKTAHQQLIREGLLQVLENIRLLGASMGLIPAKECRLEVVFADSVMQDNSTKIDNTIKLFGAGLIGREKALSEIYGLDSAGGEIVS